jgi:hypothetical protein
MKPKITARHLEKMKTTGKREKTYRPALICATFFFWGAGISPSKKNWCDLESLMSRIKTASFDEEIEERIDFYSALHRQI